ncbi:uncharacterized protein LOC122650581 [Telopea speciosissima]|uniref:uncharacterized protein LOC122650581 n=1 Tax=Telopea speciosissima TaxID=54955 RepID=UPI001CC408E9|nr:uncharacterized protein LOC122650581 [Telopea speciosissima]
MDLLENFSPASGNRKFLVVAIDNFTKWVEFEPLATITKKNMEKFFRDKIINRFGLPQVFLTYNRKQFDNTTYRVFCAHYHIEFKNIAMAYPRCNGQVKVTNRTLLDGIRKQLLDAKAKWVEELPSMLWAYRITVWTPTGETPFKLVYDTEALTPVEITDLRDEKFLTCEAQNALSVRQITDIRVRKVLTYEAQKTSSVRQITDLWVKKVLPS